MNQISKCANSLYTKAPTAQYNQLSENARSAAHFSCHLISQLRCQLLLKEKPFGGAQFGRSAMPNFACHRRNLAKLLAPRGSPFKFGIPQEFPPQFAQRISLAQQISSAAGRFHSPQGEFHKIKKRNALGISTAMCKARIMRRMRTSFAAGKHHALKARIILDFHHNSFISRRRLHFFISEATSLPSLSGGALLAAGASRKNAAFSLKYC